MTEPGASDGVSWIDVAASAVGIESSMREIGHRAGAALTDSVRSEVTARSHVISDGLLAGLDDSRASIAGATFGQAIGRAIGAPIELARTAFQGLTRDGTASADALRTHFNEVEQQALRTADSIRRMQTEAKASAAGSGGGVYDASKILAAQNQLKSYQEESRKAAAAIRETDDAAESAGHSFSFTGIQAGIMGGAIGAGALIGIESFDELISKATELGEKLLDAGEVQEGINRRLQTSTAATGEQLEGLIGDVNRVASSTSASFGVVTDATAALSTRLGLAGPALDSVATKIADAGELLGRPLDVQALTASMRALGVSASDAGRYVDMLFNVARASGDPMADLVSEISQNASVLSAFGLNADQSAQLLAGLSEAGIKDSAVIRGLNPLVREAEKAHESFGDRLKEVVGHMEAAHDSWLKLHDQADLDTENYWASKFGTRGAIAFKEAVDNGTLSVASLSSALGDVPTEGVDQVYDSTLNLSDRLSILSHQIDSDLGPLGEVLQHSLGDALGNIGKWVAANTPVIIGFLSSIGTVAIEMAGKIAGALANVAGMVGSLEAGFGLLTGNDQTKQAGEHLQDLGQQMATLGDHTDQAVKSFQDLMDRAKNTATISQDLKTALKTGTDGALQLGDPASLDTLRKAGVDIQDNAGKFTIHADTDEAAKTVRDLLASIPAAKDIPVTVTPTVEPPAPASGAPAPPPAPAPNGSAGGGDSGTPAPPDSFDWLNPFGIGENSQGFDILDPWGLFQNDDPDFRKRQAAQPPGTGGRPAPHARPSGDEQSIPATLDVQPASFKQTVSDVLTAAGVPDRLAGPDGITLPTMPSVRDAPTFDRDGLMGKAGVPSSLVGPLPDGTDDGVLLPTAFDTSKPGSRMSVSDLMTSIGIATENQGDDGVTLDVSYNSTPGSSGGPGVPGAIPAGYNPGSGGGGPVTTDGTQQSNAKAIIELAKQRGYSPEQTQAILSTGLQESGLSESAVGGGGAWRGIFQQDTGYPNRDNASGNIQGFFDRLGPPSGDVWKQIFKLQQGTDYNAPGARQAYLGEIQSKLPEAQQLYAQLASNASTPSSSGVPAPVSSGGSLNGVGAIDTPDASSPRHGGIPGAPSGMGQDVLAYIQGVMTQFNTQTGSHLNITATYPGGPFGGHPDDGGDHSARRALDISGGQREMDQFAAMWVNSPALVAATRQLIHNPAGDPGGPFTADQNVIGGRLVNGWQVYGNGPEGMPGHGDHVHVAMQDVPGAGAGGPAATVEPADYQSGNMPTVMDVSRTTSTGGGDPGNPQVAAPTAPGSTYSQVAPPPGMTPAPPGAPHAVDVPGYGQFQYSWDLPPDEQAKLRPEQKEKRDTWIQRAQDLMERQQSTAQQITDLQNQLTQAKADKDTADELPDDPADPDAKKRADDHYDEVNKRLTDALQQQTREQTQSRIDAEKPPPYEKDSKGSSDSSSDASDLGKGLVKGVFQEFGIDGSVFKGTKSPNEWGVTKLFGGILSYGLNIAAAKHGDNSGGGDGSSTGSSDGTDGGLLGMVENAIPALKSLLHPNGPDGQPVTANAPGAPALPAGTPASGVGTGPAPGPTDSPAAPGAPPTAPAAPSTPAPSTPAPVAPSAPSAPGPAAPASRAPSAGAPGLHPGYTPGSPDRPATPPPLFGNQTVPGMTVAPSSVTLPPAATSGTLNTQPGVWNPAAPQPGGAPAPAANTPAAIGSATPAVPAASTGPGTNVNNPLTVNVTNQGFAPTPSAVDTIKSISVSTSASALSGGAGIPL